MTPKQKAAVECICKSVMEANPGVDLPPGIFKFIYLHDDGCRKPDGGSCSCGDPDVVVEIDEFSCHGHAFLIEPDGNTHVLEARSH